jgi:hypothetical protein
VPVLVWRGGEAAGFPVVPAPHAHPGLEDEWVPRPCVLHPERVTEYPWHEDLPPSLRAAAQECAPAYGASLSVATGWKAGGWASWHNTDMQPTDCAGCGARMPLVLSIDSSEWGGTDDRWCPVEEREIGPGPERYDCTEPTGIVVGRFGQLNIFACPDCPTQPPHLIVQ